MLFRHSKHAINKVVKVDVILGRSSLVNVTGLVQGYYTGYCAELCGSGHGSCLVVLLCMPASSF